VLHRKLGAGYVMLEDPDLRKELLGLTRERSPEEQVGEALRDAIERMRRLALEEVQRILDEAEPYVQQLPPTPGGRALFCAVALRRAHVALLRGDTTAAEGEIQRGLSADPDFTLDQAQEPPTLVELFDRVRDGIREAPAIPLNVTTKPAGATVVLGGTPRGVAPVQVNVPAQATVTVWAVRDGYRPRNVTTRAEKGATGGTLSVQIQLDALPRAQQARPLLDALRGTGPAARPSTAATLARFLGVDAILLTQLGPNARPRIEVYGAPPQWSSPVPEGLDLIFLPPPRTQGRKLPPWAWALIGGGIGAVVTGVIVGAALR
jgi:hypothetical protein